MINESPVSTWYITIQINMIQSNRWSLIKVASKGKARTAFHGWETQVQKIIGVQTWSIS